MVWFFKFLIVQVVFRSIAWAFVQTVELIGSVIPDAVAANARAAWVAVGGVLWNPWSWAALVPIALLGDRVALARRRRMTVGRQTGSVSTD